MVYLLLMFASGIGFGILIGRQRKISVDEAITTITYEVRRSDEYALCWHCCLSEACEDEGIDHEDSEAAARVFMYRVFGKTMSVDEYVQPSIKRLWKKQHWKK